MEAVNIHYIGIDERRESNKPTEVHTLHRTIIQYLILKITFKSLLKFFFIFSVLDWVISTYYVLTFGASTSLICSVFFATFIRLFMFDFVVVVALYFHIYIFVFGVLLHRRKANWAISIEAREIKRLFMNIIIIIRSDFKRPRSSPIRKYAFVLVCECICVCVLFFPE